MNVLLYGPPGIGKSTLVQELGKLEVFPLVLDLEEVPQEEWHQPRHNAIVGMAGVHPSYPFNNSVKVLLYMDQRDYELRRQLRDEQHPEKAAQKRHFLSDWYTMSYYDFAVNVSGDLGTVLQRLSTICSLTLV